MPLSIHNITHLLGHACLPSVLWHCWLGTRKSIRPVKIEYEVLVWLSVYSMVQTVCIWSSWCHCITKPHHFLPHLNPDWFFTFLVPAYPGCHGKELLNGCNSSSSSSSGTCTTFCMSYLMVFIWSCSMRASCLTASSSRITLHQHWYSVNTRCKWWSKTRLTY